MIYGWFIHSPVYLNLELHEGDVEMVHLASHPIFVFNGYFVDVYIRPKVGKHYGNIIMFGVYIWLLEVLYGKKDPAEGIGGITVPTSEYIRIRVPPAGPLNLKYSYETRHFIHLLIR